MDTSTSSAMQAALAAPVAPAARGRARGAQRLLPPLSASASSDAEPQELVVQRRSAAQDAKIERLKQPPQPTDESDTDTALRAAEAASKKPSSMARFGAHIFFNRRPLEMLRRTTSTLLASSSSNSSGGNGRTSGATGVAAASTTDRKVWPPQRPAEGSGRPGGVAKRRLQQLPEKEKAALTRHTAAKPALPSRPRPQQPHSSSTVPKDASALSHRRARHVERSRDVDSSSSRQESSSPQQPAPTAVAATGPLSGKQFLLGCPEAARRQLTKLEQSEILQYDEIHFPSSLAVKRQRRGGQIRNEPPLHRSDLVPGEDDSLLATDSEDDAAELANNGYDDERGDYLVLLGDHLAYRYEVQHALGHGSFGQVVSCLDHRTQRQVAVKIIRNRRKYRDQALVEVQLLAQLQRAADDEEAASGHRPGIVRMEEYFLFREHVCIVFEVLGADLYGFLKRRYFHGLPMASVRVVGAQLVDALRFLKQQRIVHCDLKPENVLLLPVSKQDEEQRRSSGLVLDVRLIDFGSSCRENGEHMSYVQSRFYRSPEVLLGHAYSAAVDMWSLACILVELHTGHPVFAGENEREQLACIQEVLGEPDAALLAQCSRRGLYFDETEGSSAASTTFTPKPFVNSRGRRRVPGSRSLTRAAQSQDADFVAFLAKCFVWDPAQRLTPEQALQEPWIQRHSQRQSRELVPGSVEYEL